MNKEKYSEDDLRDFFIFKYNNQCLYKEVPVFSRSVDLVKYDEHAKTMTAIEFKIHDWKKAMQQAIDVSMCFDYIAICIPKPKTLKCIESIVAECKKLGIGIYVYDEQTSAFEHIFFEQKIVDVWKKQRTTILQYLEDNTDG